MKESLPCFSRGVNYYETDRMGVVHHSNYLRILEEARFFWFEQIGFPYPEIERRGIIIPCIRASEQFCAFLRYGDRFCVRLTLTGCNGLRMQYHYEIENAATGQICYIADTEHCFTRDGDYLPLPIRRKYPELYEKMCQCVDAASTPAAR